MTENWRRFQSFAGNDNIIFGARLVLISLVRNQTTLPS
jgi:hypothetical protein